jgi:hypothetical protein
MSCYDLTRIAYTSNRKAMASYDTSRALLGTLLTLPPGPGLVTPLGSALQLIRAGNVHALAAQQKYAEAVICFRNSGTPIPPGLVEAVNTVGVALVHADRAQNLVIVAMQLSMLLVPVQPFITAAMGELHVARQKLDSIPAFHGARIDAGAAA